VKYYVLEDLAVGNGEPRRSFRSVASKKSRGTHTGANNARGKVLSYHRNYKDESASDRAIRERNEQRLRENAEKLKQKKVSRKK
jgi:hypothetical protein